MSARCWSPARTFIGSALSAVTRNQVTAFVLAIAVCFVFAVASYPVVTDFLSRNTALADVARRIAVIDPVPGLHPRRGVGARPDLLRQLMGFWLFLNTVLVEGRAGNSMRRLLTSIVGVLAVAAIVIGINLFGRTARTRQRACRSDREPHLHAVVGNAETLGPT